MIDYNSVHITFHHTPSDSIDMYLLSFIITCRNKKLYVYIALAITHIMLDIRTM